MEYNYSNSETEDYNNNQCAYDFYVPTRLDNFLEEQTKDKQNSDPLQYRFDISPGNICYNNRQSFQGSALSSHAPPSALRDVERYLQTNSLKIELNHAITDNIHNGIPSIPAELNNKFIIPECDPQLTWSTTKMYKNERQEWSTPENMNVTKNQPNFMQVGVNTRLQVKDEYKRNNPRPQVQSFLQFSAPVLRSNSSSNVLGEQNMGSQYSYQKFPCSSDISKNYLNCNR